MSRPRGRPVGGTGLERSDVLAAALAMLAAGQPLSMRTLAGRLGVSPMSLYHHVDDRVGLLRALADEVYASVLDEPDEQADALAQARALLLRYHAVVEQYPQLTLAIASEPRAFAGASRRITERLARLLGGLSDDPDLWCDILVDHAHGNGLALASMAGDTAQIDLLRKRYRQALASLLGPMSRAVSPIRYAVRPCSLGHLLVAQSPRGICAILLGDDPESLVNDLNAQFPSAESVAGGGGSDALADRVVAFVETPARGLPVPLDVQGTAFQKRVWQALREIPPGTTVSYTALADRIGQASAVRAVARACATNCIAVAIPCHRVVRRDGDLAGYRWGVERKRELLRREGGQRVLA